ncbi:hypothetical protein BDZ89DRAFT_533783 [Hymenopellis radicata]|nr:hypothetical protein BDZ89DRAFT_533783 [Hymenopellis radicata]
MSVNWYPILLSLAFLSRDVSRRTFEYTFSSAVSFGQLSETIQPYHLRKQQDRAVDSFIKFSNGTNPSESIAMQISLNLPRTARGRDVGTSGRIALKQCPYQQPHLSSCSSVTTSWKLIFSTIRTRRTGVGRREARTIAQ